MAQHREPAADPGPHRGVRVEERETRARVRAPREDERHADRVHEIARPGEVHDGLLRPERLELLVVALRDVEEPSEDDRVPRLAVHEPREEREREHRDEKEPEEAPEVARPAEEEAAQGLAARTLEEHL